MGNRSGASYTAGMNDDPRFRTPQPSPARRGQARRDRPVPRPAAEPPPPGTERLQKVLADAGVASRRDCEMLVFEGRVRVNGRTVRELPCWVRPQGDLIEVDGETVEPRAHGTPLARAGSRARLYLMLHKPKGVISTAHDPEGRTSVVGLVSAAVPPGERVYPVGRLDADSTGLVLLTNDGELTARLTHPRHGVTKTYRVAVAGEVTHEHLERLKKGMFLATPDAILRTKGGGTGAGAKRAVFESVRVLDRRLDRSRGGMTLLTVSLREGQNREIRRLLARVGLKVRRLERIAIGELQLGALPCGAFRALRAVEVERLRAVAGLDGAPLRAARRPAQAASRPEPRDPDSQVPRSPRQRHAELRQRPAAPPPSRPAAATAPDRPPRARRARRPRSPG